MKTVALLIALSATLANPAVAQKLYKWVDADGNVHYSDSVPPEHIKQARQQFNEDGVVVDRVERAPTAEELAARQEAERQAEAEARRIERQREEDQKLLSIYSSEDDILRSRDQQVQSIQRSIDAAQAFIDGQSKTLATLMERASKAEDAGQTVGEQLAASIASAQQQIRDQEDYIIRREAEKQAAALHYAEILDRYREILARRSVVAEPAQTGG